MNTLEEKTDYDLFDYEYDAPAPLTLDEAIKKAQDLRSKSSGDVVYRIVPTDTKATGFRVVSVPKEEVFASFLSKFSQWMIRFASPSKHR